MASISLLALFTVAIVVAYPLVAPWRRPFLLGWLGIWFTLWIAFLALASHESKHVTKGMVSDSAIVGLAISALTVTSIIRLLAYGLALKWRSASKKHEQGL